MEQKRMEEGRAAAGAAVVVRRPVPKSLSHLQGLLQLAHSQEIADQQQAAIELAALIEKAPLPAFSFGPVAHALCKLLPSGNRTTVYYAGRAAKLLVLDDALRSQALPVGLPGVLAQCLRAWEEEIPCLRELLAALQTLAYDKATVSSIVALPEGGGRKPELPSQWEGAIIPSAEEGADDEAGANGSAGVGEAGAALGTILLLLEARDGEVKALATATVANLCAYSDTLLLAHRPFLDGMRTQGLPALVRAVQSPDNKLLCCYAMAALANAARHPLLAGRLRELDAVAVITKAEEESARQTRGLALGGASVAECAEAAMARLGVKCGNGDGGAGVSSSAAASMLGLGARRWTFKWGTQPVLELSIDSSKGRYGALGCFLVWIACFLLVLRPALQSGGESFMPGM